MFISHRVDVTDLLVPTANSSTDDTNSNPNSKHNEHNNQPESAARRNKLEITFLPALRESQRIKAAHPDHKWVGFNADMARLAARKAQYHYGWDWGPVLLTCGPWGGIRLESHEARVVGLRVGYEICLHDSGGIGRGMVSGTLRAEVEGVREERMKVRFAAETGEVAFRILEAQLWWPHGYVEQALYDVTATLLSREGTEFHSVTQRTGFRKGELIQEPDQSGKSFYFRFNGVDVFCGGSDWIPADSFTPRISRDKYRHWLETLREGNQVMIRVWGGGIWEEDVFYDLCDELGILVWQDSMFGCGNYPVFPAMLTSIEEEGVCQMKRLQHLPSLAILAGNNEDYQVQEQMGLTYDYADKDPQSWLKTDFQARYIYEKLLPDIVASHCPHVPYHPSSPWGDGKPTSDPTVGDMHQWNVWHDTQEKYQIFDTLGGRFNSEFGLEAFPHLDTIKAYLTDPSQLYPQSHMLDFHNKADGHERRIATYLVENFRSRTEIAAFIRLSQLSQAEALTFGYRGWRRQGGQNRRCGGALVRQVNDCWPVTSWSIVDCFLRKKPAYYAMRRALAPVAIAVKRAHHDWSVVHARSAKTSTWECWVASSRLAEVSATVQLRFVSIAMGKDVRPAVVKKDVRIAPNGSTDVFSGVIDNEREEPHVLAARLWIAGEFVARDTDWPQPLKYLDLGDRGVEVVRKGSKIQVRAAKPTKGLVFEEREGVNLSDEQVVTVNGLEDEDEELRWTYLDAPPS